ncbi:DUF2933 domain-containing protein [Qipengyuania sphaerica]|uniref:DUF2933 domain-containing protein n=1 Tax=Qipengyuania sphaerica TaxID=2867243 RepID=UPI001C88AC50|nr:DUF2933 domain-containing protein [Qipengyuania sphaerica]MBX7540273.1 DUF2933 domain-containing protein [Qipengyuania sphaerica]
MVPFEYLAIGGIVAAVAVLVYVIANRDPVGSPVLAAVLGAFFAAYTGVTIFHEGIATVWTNHTTNLWGVQVWWDLLMSVGIAVFFIVPRARAQNMAIVPWLLLVAATASIGLFAMVARLFWLEKRAATA